MSFPLRWVGPAAQLAQLGLGTGRARAPSTFLSGQPFEGIERKYLALMQARERRYYNMYEEGKNTIELGNLSTKNKKPKNQQKTFFFF